MEQDENLAKSTIDAVTGLAKAVPIYPDLVQPAAQEIGKSLQTVSRLVNVAISPIRALVWGYEKIEEFIINRVSEKLSNVPHENIVTPLASIAVPTVEALKYLGDEEELREMFANLLANSMDKSEADNTHPAFVEIIKNLSALDAIVLKKFLSKETHPIRELHAVDEQLPEDGSPPKVSGETFWFYYSHLHFGNGLLNYNNVAKCFDNLIRLGLLRLGDRLEEDEMIIDQDKEEFSILVEWMANKGRGIYSIPRCIQLTQFGYIFVHTVIKPKI